jgi:hypothetical protein
MYRTGFKNVEDAARVAGANGARRNQKHVDGPNANDFVRLLELAIELERRRVADVQARHQNFVLGAVRSDRHLSVKHTDNGRRSKLGLVNALLDLRHEHSTDQDMLNTLNAQRSNAHRSGVNVGVPW